VTASKTDDGDESTAALRTFPVLLASAGIGGVWYWGVHAKDPAEQASASAPVAAAGSTPGSTAVKSTLHLESFVINLADPGARSYLRVGIDLGLGREMGKGEDGPPGGMIRDTMIGVLGRCKVDDLLTEPGKTKLKADLLKALQQRAPEQMIQEVYFTEFLIQR
jgi:flagellar basal body-associated protein FliL